MAGPSPNSPLGDLVAATGSGDPATALAAAKRGYEAFLRGEMSLDDPAVDPNMEWIPPKHAPTAGAYRGAAEAEKEVRAWWEPFDDFRWEPKEVLLGQGCFVVVGDMGRQGSDQRSRGADGGVARVDAAGRSHRAHADVP